MIVRCGLSSDRVKSAKAVFSNICRLGRSRSVPIQAWLWETQQTTENVGFCENVGLSGATQPTKFDI